MKMRDIITIVEGNRRSTRVLYHVTQSDRITHIIKDGGLLPERSESNLKAVYLSGEPSLGYSFMGRNGPSLVLSVPLSKLDQSKLGPDDYELRDYLADRRSTREWHDHTWRESLRKTDQVAYHAAIPTDALTVHARVYDDPSGMLRMAMVDQPLSSYRPLSPSAEQKANERAYQAAKRATLDAGNLWMAVTTSKPEQKYWLSFSGGKLTSFMQAVVFTGAENYDAVVQGWIGLSLDFVQARCRKLGWRFEPRGD
jgi:hypothetical protein